MSTRRQPRLTPADLDDDQRRLYATLTEGPRARGPQRTALTDEDGSLVGPFGGFLLAPAIGDSLQQLGAAIRFHCSLTDAMRELVILMVAARRGSPFELRAHAPLGLAAGLTDEQVGAAKAGVLPEVADAHGAAIVRMADALLHGDVDEETWSACVPPLDAGEVFELIALVGYYSTLALQMRVLRVDADPA